MVTWGSTTTASFTPSTPASATPAAAATATTTTAFGTPAPAPAGTSLFAGSTPGPNAAAAATTPATGGFSFGGTTATPATGATGAATPGSAGSSLFGATTPTPGATGGGGGLFGSTPAAAPATGGLFGTPAPAPAAGGGLFGTPAPAAPAAPAPATGGLFGAAPSTPGLFGAAPAAPVTSPFAQQPQQQQQQQAAAAAAAVFAYTQHQQHLHAHNLLQETARIESSILGLEAGYSTAPTTAAAAAAVDPMTGAPSAGPACKFQHIFYDPIDPATKQAGIQPARPVNVDPATWSEAMAHNPDPDELVPVVVVGAEQLQSRIAAQQSRARDYATVIERLRGALDEVKRSVGASDAALRNADREREYLRRRLMRVMTKVEIARCMGYPLQGAEREYDDTLGRMEVDLRRLGGKLREVTDMAEVHKRKRASYARPSTIELSSDDKASLYHVLDEQRKGLEALTKIAMRDLRDVEIMKSEILPRPNDVAGAGGVGGAVAPGGLPLGGPSGAGARGSVRPFTR